MSFGRLAILVPTLNDGPYIEQCLKSLLPHAHLIEEVCISDNRSTDGAWEYISDFSSSALRIRRIRQSRTVPMFENWRRVLDMTRADFVLFLSSDDYLLPTGLDAVFDRLEREPDLTGIALPMKYFEDGGGDVVAELPPEDTESALNRAPIEVLSWMLAHANNDELIYAVWRRQTLVNAIAELSDSARESTAWWWVLNAVLSGRGNPRFGVAAEPLLMKRVGKSHGGLAAGPPGGAVALKSAASGRFGSIANAIRTSRSTHLGIGALLPLLFSPRLNSSSGAIVGAPLSLPSRFKRRGRQ